MGSFKLRQAAVNDLVKIGMETRDRWDDAQMRRYLGALDAAFRTLAAMPQLGRACDDVSPGYRRHVVGKHVVFYRIDKSGDVDIVRILHARMDVERHALLEDDEEDSS